MRKSLAILSALVISASAAAAHADPISGYFSVNGNDSFTTNTITFGTSKVDGAIGGTFASYLSDGDAVNFLMGALPYQNGMNYPPAATFPAGYVPIFSASGNGATFTFDLTSYDAEYITGSGCVLGSSCLNITGTGFFTSTGAYVGNSGNGAFTFTSQYSTFAPGASVTTFSASGGAVAPTAVTPEPSSLALLGTGLLGVVGVARRKFAL